MRPQEYRALGWRIGERIKAALIFLVLVAGGGALILLLCLGIYNPEMVACKRMGGTPERTITGTLCHFEGK